MVTFTKNLAQSVNPRDKLGKQKMSTEAVLLKSPCTSSIIFPLYSFYIQEGKLSSSHILTSQLKTASNSVTISYSSPYAKVKLYVSKLTQLTCWSTKPLAQLMQAAHVLGFIAVLLPSYKMAYQEQFTQMTIFYINT